MAGAAEEKIGPLTPTLSLGGERGPVRNKVFNRRFVF